MKHWQLLVYGEAMIFGYGLSWAWIAGLFLLPWQVS
jgi:hypothetical protein